MATPETVKGWARLDWLLGLDGEESRDGTTRSTTSNLARIIEQMMDNEVSFFDTSHQNMLQRAVSVLRKCRPALGNVTPAYIISSAVGSSIAR